MFNAVNSMIVYRWNSTEKNTCHLHSGGNYIQITSDGHVLLDKPRNFLYDSACQKTLTLFFKDFFKHFELRYIFFQQKSVIF